MAIKIGWQFTNLLLFEGMFNANLGGIGGDFGASGNRQHIYCTVFPGVQPSAASVIANWSTYSALYLAHYIYNAGVAWSSYNISDEGTAYIATTQSPSVTAYRTGIATWGIIWARFAGPSQIQIQGSSLPGTYFIIAPVGDIASSEVIRLDSTSIVESTTTTLNLITFDIALNMGD